MNSLIKKFQEFIEKSNFSGIVIAIVSFVGIFAFSVTEAYDIFEDRLYDLRFRMKPSINEWSALTSVNIDDESINNIGQFPWPRYIYSDGLEVLKTVGINQMAFDIEFPNRSPMMLNPDSFNELSEKINRKERIVSDELTSLVLDSDVILADSIKQVKNVVLPYHFQETLHEENAEEQERFERAEAMKLFIDRASVMVPEDKQEKYKSLIDPMKVGIDIPIPQFINAASLLGFVDTDPDIDGTERRVRLVRMFEGRMYFQMALVMLMDVCNVKKEDIQIEPGVHIVLKDATNPTTLKEEDIIIPIDEKGMMYINWAGPGPLEKSFNNIPFYEILDYERAKGDVTLIIDENINFQRQSEEIKKFSADLNIKYNEYYGAADLVIKEKIKQDILDIKKNIRDAYEDVSNILKEENKLIKDKLKTVKNKQEIQELEQLSNDIGTVIKAIKIINDVEKLWENVAVIGLIATGTQDIGAIPLYNKYWMLGKYINIVNTIINKSFIIKIARYINYIIMFVLSILMGIVVQRLAARMSLLVFVVSLLVVNLINFGLFAFFNTWIELLGTNLAVFLPSAIISGVKLMKEESQKRYIKNAFSRYLAPGVIDRIIESPEALELGGESRIITIFFSDVAGFSTISEKLTPTELVKRLNEYLTEMTDIILLHGGTVDKYEGDAIMAFYGAPHAFEDHALRCLLATIDMKKKLREMQEMWRKIGVDELFVRMGMNTGETVVGNMGSKARLDYTAMGDAVNLASRLEGANKYYKTSAMMSGATYEAAKDHIEARKLDVIRVVGKSEPILVYELLGRKGTLPDIMYDMLEQYHTGLDYFNDRDWKKSLSLFKKASKIIDDDGPTQTYIERCEKFMKKPPPKKWDGVYKLTSK